MSSVLLFLPYYEEGDESVWCTAVNPLNFGTRPSASGFAARNL